MPSHSILGRLFWWRGAIEHVRSTHGALSRILGIAWCRLNFKSIAAPSPSSVGSSIQTPWSSVLVSSHQGDQVRPLKQTNCQVGGWDLNTGTYNFEFWCQQQQQPLWGHKGVTGTRGNYTAPFVALILAQEPLNGRLRSPADSYSA